MRIALGVVAGLVVAFACVFGIEVLGAQIYPPPAGLNPNNPEDLERMMTAMPFGGLVVVVLAWFVGTLVGGWVAALIAKRRLAIWIVAIVVLLACLANMVMLTHPAWMWVAGLAAPLLGGWVAERLARPPA